MNNFLKLIQPIWRPHKGQEEFLVNTSKLKVLACGRRWGKTDACAIQVIHTLLNQTSSKHLLIAPTLDQAKILFDRVLSFLEKLMKAGLANFESISAPKFSPYP